MKFQTAIGSLFACFAGME